MAVAVVAMIKAVRVVALVMAAVVSMVVAEAAAAAASLKFGGSTSRSCSNIASGTRGACGGDG